MNIQALFLEGRVRGPTYIYCHMVRLGNKDYLKVCQTDTQHPYKDLIGRNCIESERKYQKSFFFGERFVN